MENIRQLSFVKILHIFYLKYMSPPRNFNKIDAFSAAAVGQLLTAMIKQMTQIRTSFYILYLSEDQNDSRKQPF